MNDLMSISEATKQEWVHLTGRQLRNLCAAGMGCRRDGRWFVSRSALARYLRSPNAEPLPHLAIGNMLIEAGKSLQNLSPDFPGLLERAISAFVKGAGSAVVEGTAANERQQP